MNISYNFAKRKKTLGWDRSSVQSLMRKRSSLERRELNTIQDGRGGTYRKVGSKQKGRSMPV